ncbi:phage holin family protein [Robbsia sp. Bb-Pol-6]|uniref:Phage holin family protein n=1 Tax=Robbsia betulipollinis TaxID=2981849 RepID=A0ABT3ZM66_9BURK|nr:phage holin family protein [Robbsia betulipollinis]MCY0387619.1 phage holin family protein [Robbsia betulipollinis]
MAQASLVQSLRQLLVGAISQTSSRLRLLALEVIEERDRVLALLVAALVACFFVFMAVIFGAVLIIAAYWDTPSRLAAIGWLAGGAFLVAVLAVVFFIYRVKKPTTLFNHSLSELEKDRKAVETLQ